MRTASKVLIITGGVLAVLDGLWALIAPGKQRWPGCRLVSPGRCWDSSFLPSDL